MEKYKFALVRLISSWADQPMNKYILTERNCVSKLQKPLQKHNVSQPHRYHHDHRRYLQQDAKVDLRKSNVVIRKSASSTKVVPNAISAQFLCAGCQNAPRQPFGTSVPRKAQCNFGTSVPNRGAARQALNTETWLDNQTQVEPKPRCPLGVWSSEQREYSLRLAVIRPRVSI